MEISLRVDMGNALEATKKAPEEMAKAIHQTLLEVAIYTQRVFRQNMPVGKTGMLRRTTTYVWLGDARVRIEPVEEYAEYVEFGTRPHFPPVEAITPWARMRGIEPWALAHSIAKHGTKAHPFLQKTYEQVEPYANTALAQNVDKVIEKYL